MTPSKQTPPAREKTYWHRLIADAPVVVLLVGAVALDVALTTVLGLEGLIRQLVEGANVDLVVNRSYGFEIAVLVLVLLAWLSDRRRVLLWIAGLTLAVVTFDLLTSVVTLLLTLTVRGNAGYALLRDAVVVWFINILVFAGWYWLLDFNKRRRGALERGADFLFPAESSEVPGHAVFRPNLMDYLYLAFTNSSAFSPTDVMPLTARAKFLMMIQASASVVIILTLVTRAISSLN